MKWPRFLLLFFFTLLYLAFMPLRKPIILWHRVTMLHEWVFRLVMYVYEKEVRFRVREHLFRHLRLLFHLFVFRWFGPLRLSLYPTKRAYPVMTYVSLSLPYMLPVRRHLAILFLRMLFAWFLDLRLALSIEFVRRLNLFVRRR